MFDWLKISPDGHGTNFKAKLFRLVSRYKGKASDRDIVDALDMETLALTGASSRLRQIEAALVMLQLAEANYRRSVALHGPANSAAHDRLQALKQAGDRARALLAESDPANDPDVRAAFVVPEGGRLATTRDALGRIRFTRPPLQGGDDE